MAYSINDLEYILGFDNINEFDWPQINKHHDLFSSKIDSNNQICIGLNIDFSKQAMRVLNSLAYLGIKVYHIDETKSYDGYDKHGTKAIIMNLYIFTYDSSFRPVKLTFTFEKQYYPNDILEYYLEDVYSYSLNSKPTTYTNILQAMLL